MTTRERRSLWGSISTSKKVNALSDRALILYILTISHLDDEGFIDGDPRVLKSTVIPLRDNIQIKDIEGLVNEISTVHSRVQSTPIPLWLVHKTTQGVFIQDPVFNERQSFKGIRKKPSKIKDVVDAETEGKQKGAGGETEGCLSEVKGKVKGKGSEVNVKGDDTPGAETYGQQNFEQQLVDLFNLTTQYLPKVTELGKSRKDKIKTRIKEGKDKLDWWKLIFEKADMILIPGKDGKKDWFPNFDWLIENDKNSVKVFEGNYDDAKRPQSPFRPQPGISEFLERHREEEKNEP